MALDIFFELTLIIVLATAISGLMKILKQPLIIGYIITGILISPYFLDIMDSTRIIETFSHIGIALLLFIVGLSINLNLLKNVGRVSLLTGIGQVVFTSGIGFVIAGLLGFGNVTSIYIAVALAFSSTIIITKLLSDKGDLDTLYGRISLGFLLVQDLIVVLVLIILSSMGKGGVLGVLIFRTLLIILVLIGAVLLFSHFVLSRFIKYVARSQEFLLLFSLGWCFLLSSLFYMMDFSIEVGALLAGISLASTPYKFEISSKMRPLRDFFLVLFFVMLGSQMVFGGVNAYVLPVIIFSLFVLIGNPLIVIILMGIMGYTRRNGFLAGLSVAQISEFSFILVSMGMKMGHVSEEVLGLVTMVGLITITGSSYMIMYSHRIYPLISRYLKVFERNSEKIDEHKYHNDEDHEVILFGYNGIGADLLSSLRRMKKKFLIVDYDPETIVSLAREGYDCRYGDASDIEMLEEINFKEANMVISTLPETEANMLLIGKIREKNENCIIIALTHHIEDALELYEKGASYVILPHFLGGKYVSTMIEDYEFNVDYFLEEKVKHVNDLKHRRKGRKAPF